MADADSSGQDALFACRFVRLSLLFETAHRPNRSRIIDRDGRAGSVWYHNASCKFERGRGSAKHRLKGHPARGIEVQVLIGAKRLDRGRQRSDVPFQE